MNKKGRSRKEIKKVSWQNFDKQIRWAKFNILFISFLFFNFLFVTCKKIWLAVPIQKGTCLQIHFFLKVNFRKKNSGMRFKFRSHCRRFEVNTSQLALLQLERNWFLNCEQVGVRKKSCETWKNYSNTKVGNEISFKRQVHFSFLPAPGSAIARRFPLELSQCRFWLHTLLQETSCRIGILNLI